MSPAHMMHGSNVTYTVQPVSLHTPSSAAAAFMATNSACPAGSCCVSRMLHARAITRGSARGRRVALSIGRYTTTAPMGTSPIAAARCASSSAMCMYSSSFISIIIWYPTNLYGGMAEWLKAAVLKTVEPQGSVGSNPTSSARMLSPGSPGVFFFLNQPQLPI